MRRDVPAAPRPQISPAVVRATDGQWTLELPFTAMLSLNDRDHHMAKWRKTQKWVDATRTLVRAARIPPCRRIRVELHYVPAQDRTRDPDNMVAMLKPIVDGIKREGVVPDDDLRYVEREWPIIHPKGPVRPAGNRFWVVIAALEAS